jgi:putative PIN family toxin of toxin-antitoxin system
MEPKHRPRIFLDSNVLFSALYSSSGAPHAILSHIINGRLKLVISEQVLEEIVRTIKGKLPEALADLRKLLVSSPLEITEDRGLEAVAPWAEIVDIGDAGILAAAVEAQPDYLITGDRHFFKNPGIADKSGLKIITPAQFLESWLGEAGPS